MLTYIHVSTIWFEVWRKSYISTFIVTIHYALLVTEVQLTREKVPYIQNWRVIISKYLHRNHALGPNYTSRLQLIIYSRYRTIEHIIGFLLERSISIMTPFCLFSVTPQSIGGFVARDYLMAGLIVWGTTWIVLMAPRIQYTFSDVIYIRDTLEYNCISTTYTVVGTVN